MEETKGKIQKASEVLAQCPLLDRTKCFETVAAGVKAIVPDSVVDLKSPEVIYIQKIIQNLVIMLHHLQSPEDWCGKKCAVMCSGGTLTTL